MTPELTVRVGPGVVLLTSATLVFPLLMLLMPRGSTPWPPVWLVLGLTNVLTWTVLRRDGRTALRRCLVLRDPILELAADADGADGRFADGS
ncbi:MAG: hypothetical protein KC731_21130 [Myxococcales bacterium]|nr:hypothetical protein [Myxococcales bacterium]